MRAKCRRHGRGSRGRLLRGGWGGGRIASRRERCARSVVEESARSRGEGGGLYRARRGSTIQIVLHFTFSRCSDGEEMWRTVFDEDRDTECLGCWRDSLYASVYTRTSMTRSHRESLETHSRESSRSRSDARPQGETRNTRPPPLPESTHKPNLSLCE